MRRSQRPPLSRPLGCVVPHASLTRASAPQVLGTLALLAVLTVVSSKRARERAESSWLIRAAELDVSSSQVLGRGSFGLVITANYRGTTVALKRGTQYVGRKSIRPLLSGLAVRCPRSHMPLIAPRPEHAAAVTAIPSGPSSSAAGEGAPIFAPLRYNKGGAAAPSTSRPLLRCGSAQDYVE